MTRTDSSNRGPTPPRWLMLAVGVLLTLVWGTSWGMISIGLKAGLPPFTGSALRFVLAGAVMVGAAVVLGHPLWSRDKVERRVLWANAVGSFVISYGAVYWAQQFVPSGLASVIFASFPLFMALLAHFFLAGERMGPGGLVGVVLGFAGIAVIFADDLSMGDDPRAQLAITVLLLAPIASAVADLAIKGWGGGLHPITLSAVPMSAGAGALVAMALVWERPVEIPVTLPALGSMVYLALLATALNFGLYFWLLRHAPATKVSMLAYTIPVVAVIFGVTVLGEPWSGQMVVGTVAVIAGVALSSFSQRH
ncbi:MAG: EamA family transporter [Acidobacteriota bacterium]